MAWWNPTDHAKRAWALKISTSTQSAVSLRANLIFLDVSAGGGEQAVPGSIRGLRRRASHDQTVLRRPHRLRIVPPLISSGSIISTKKHSAACEGYTNREAASRIKTANQKQGADVQRYFHSYAYLLARGRAFGHHRSVARG